MIGAVNDDLKENAAFIYLSNHFKNQGLPVPEIYGWKDDSSVYLQEDLGDHTLFSTLTGLQNGLEFPEDAIALYKKAINWLPKFQVKGAKLIDFRNCYPRPAFDKQSIMWDLNYFKYYFLKLSHINFDEQALEEDFETLCNFLLKPDSTYFLYRDFQSRNIMIKDNEIYFIDYQGGRKGALHYDIASLLYDAKADLPEYLRKELIDYYLDKLSEFVPIEKSSFLNYYYAFVYIRIMQAMGAYGFRGFYEKKLHFLLSIPYALKNLEYLLENHPIPIKLPVLTKVLNQIINSPVLRTIAQLKLTVNINSFSYKKGIPTDLSGNGGGFVFDCRALPNPGRLQGYEGKTGKDKEVADYLNSFKEVNEFSTHVLALVDQSVKTYQSRGFTNLMISFGCTGGQHRSVYLAEMLANYLKKYDNLTLELNHKEQSFPKTANQ